MARHRTLALHKFVSAISPDVVQRYMERIPTDRRPDAWATLNGDALDHFLSQPENADVAAPILEDFRRVNDISEQGMGIVVHACEKFGVPVANERTSEELALVLFLDKSDGFDFAWSRYLLLSSEARLSLYQIPAAGVRADPERLQQFERETRDWFTHLAKGEQCIINCYEDNGETMITIKHGSYFRTQAFWQGKDIVVDSFRPALEDVLVYDPGEALLQIKASLPKDRDEYLRLFATHIAGDPALADKAREAEVFTLGPVQMGTFNYQGDGVVARVDLVEVRIKIFGVTNPVVNIKADNVVEALRHDVQGLSLNSGLITYAKFRFLLLPPGHPPTKVTFEIQPPAHTDLAQKEHAETVLLYLRQQGVRLR